MLIPRRTPLFLVTSVAALALTSAPAFAGEDNGCSGASADASAFAVASGQSSPCPAATPTPVPPQPTPVPVQPTPVPAQPTPAPTAAPESTAPTAPAAKAAKPTVKTRTVVRYVRVQAPVRVQRVAQTTATVPQGGVQAGAGGTAPQPSGGLSPALAVPGLLLALLVFGGGLRLAQARSRR